MLSAVAEAATLAKRLAVAGVLGAAFHTTMTNQELAMLTALAATGYASCIAVGVIHREAVKEKLSHEMS